MKALRGPQGIRAAAGALAHLAVAGVIGAAGIFALGRPDLGLAMDFLTSGRPDRDGAVATIQLVVWVLVAALVLVQALEAARRTTSLPMQRRGRRARAQLVLLAGLLVFAGGAIHHQEGAGSLCCGDAARAERLVR